MQPRKKILFLSSWYPVPENPTHGIFVQRHAKAVSLLHDVFVLYCTGTEDLKQEEIVHSSGKSFSERIVFYDKKGMNGYQKFRTLRNIYGQAFEKLMAEWGKPDLIHVNVAFPVGIFAVLLSKKYKIPFVVTEHWTGYLPEDGSYRGFLKKHFTKKIIMLSSAVCPVTKHLGDAMQRLGLKGRYVPVPNVVDTDFFLPSRIKDKDKTVFLHLSSFDERQKNPRSIIDAFNSLTKEGVAAELIMAGDGDNINELKNYASQKSASKQISFVFRPMADELLKLFHRADALVLNSNYENLPVVILEAMSCGLPVISSAVGGIHEYVNDSNGILFSPPAVQNLFAAMKNFIEQKGKFDSDRIRAFAVEQFSLKNVAAKYDEVYKSVLC